MENSYYVYEWYNIETGEVFYVGKGRTRRKNDLYGRNKFFLDYYNTHKCSNRIILSNLNEEEAFEYEKKVISYYKSNTNFRLTNQTDGGEGVSRYGEENSMHHTKYVRPIEWRKQHSKRMKGNKNALGCTRSKETRAKISEKLSGKNHPNYGKHHSKETRLKMSNNSYFKTEEGRKKLQGANNPNSKRIMFIYENGEVLIFETMKEANVIMNSNFIRKFSNLGIPFYSRISKYKHLNGIRVVISKKGQRLEKA